MKKFLCGFLASVLLCASVAAVAAVAAVASSRIKSAGFNKSRVFLATGTTGSLITDEPMIGVIDAETPAFMKTYMPPREVLEWLGYGVDWDESSGNALLSEKYGNLPTTEDSAERYRQNFALLVTNVAEGGWAQYGNAFDMPSAFHMHVGEEFCDVIAYRDVEDPSAPLRDGYADLSFVVLSKITGNPRMMFRRRQTASEEGLKEMYRFSNGGKTMHYGDGFCYELDLATDKLSHTPPA